MLEKNCPEPLEASDSSTATVASKPHSARSKILPHETEVAEENITPVNTQLQLQQPANKKKTGRSRKPSNKNQTKKQSKAAATPKAQKPPKPLRDQHQHKLTEYFPVRRSVRKPEKLVLEERWRDLQSKVADGVEDGLQITTFVDKGRGITTTRDFVKGEFVVEYAGELIDSTKAKEREAKYSKDANTGCYMYYFRYRDQQYCVDATAESGKLGRLINHSRNGNLTTRIIEVGGLPRLVFLAKENIATGMEVSYDYGDRNRESLRNHPWLAL